MNYEDLIQENRILKLKLSQSKQKINLLEGRLKENEENQSKIRDPNKGLEENHLTTNNSNGNFNYISYIKKLEEKMNFYRLENENNVERLSKKNEEYDKLYQKYIQVITQKQNNLLKDKFLEEKTN